MSVQPVKPPTYYQHPRTELYDFLQRSGRTAVTRVLSVGCGSGADAPVLRALGATRIVGVEPVASAAALAREHYDTVTTGAFEDWQPPGDERFDLVVFADVLEHLVDPGAALRRARDVLAPDGVVLVSVPNVRCILVPAQLILRGDWPTAVEGIFDATHLRFFTSKSMRRLLVQAGLRPLAHLNYSLHFAPLIRRGLVPRLVSEFLAMQNFFLAEIR